MRTRRPRKTAFAAGIFLIAAVAAGCTEEQGQAEGAGEKIDQAAGDLHEDAEETAEAAGDAIEETGGAVEDATDQ